VAPCRPLSSRRETALWQTALWHCLLTVPQRGLTEGLHGLRETFGQAPWHGQETVPQRGETVPQRGETVPQRGSHDIPPGAGRVSAC
jgi:hypothetical protein